MARDDLFRRAQGANPTVIIPCVRHLLHTEIGHEHHFRDGRIHHRPVRTMRTANGVVFRKFHVGMPVRKNTTHA